MINIHKKVEILDELDPTPHNWKTATENNWYKCTIIVNDKGHLETIYKVPFLEFEDIIVGEFP